MSNRSVVDQVVQDDDIAIPDPPIRRAYSTELKEIRTAITLMSSQLRELMIICKRMNEDLDILKKSAMRFPSHSNHPEVNFTPSVVYK